jgi:hypothetical protein
MNGVKFHKLPKEKREAILRGMISAGTNHEGQSNREFAAKNGGFQAACEAAGIKPTKRQASKFRNKTGTAYNV